MNTPEPTVGHIDQARRFAALSGPFDPRDAIAANITSAGGDDAVVATASYLAMACDTK